MNNNQRIAIAVALVVIGFVLSYSMLVVDNETRGTYYNTLVFSWETQPYFGPPSRNNPNGTPDDWMPYFPAGRKYLYVTRGIPGILLGLIAPLGLWAVAAYIALGSKKIDANLPMKGGPAPPKTTATPPPAAAAKPTGKPGKVIATDSSGKETIFKGATVDEAAKLARREGYKPYEISHMDGTPYRAPIMVLREAILPTAVPLVTPLGLWAVVAYIALGSKKIDANLPMKGGPAPGKEQVIARDKFGNEVKFTGATVHEAAVKAKAAGYSQIFNLNNTPYQPSAPAKS